jgi:signal transduction histidine kinase/ActR/RegA family two-component response regulator
MPMPTPSALAATAAVSRVLLRMPLPLCVFRGRALVYEMANDLYCEAIGRRDVVGRPLCEVLPELCETGYDERLRRAMEMGELFTTRELPLRVARGGATLETYWAVFCAPLADDPAAADRVMMICTDVTDHVQMRRQLDAATRAKDEFLATLSHELRSPLNAIIGWTHILRSGSAEESTVPRALEAIHRNAIAQSQLIADILDMQRLTSGKLRLSLRDVDAAGVIEAALDTVRPAAQAKDITLRPRLEPGGPVHADPTRLQQIVWNLVSNAIKFTPHGGSVDIRLRRPESHVEIVVEDTGPGISPEFLPYIFDRFRQADASASRRHGGLGLGLAIVRSLTELHGGTVVAANGVGGAVFTVTLPHSRVQPTLDRRTGGNDAWLRSAPSLHGTKVLVIDDEPEAREVVAIVLAQCGAAVVAAKSSAEGVSLLLSERPDVLLCDVEMPEEDGYDFIRRVRQLPADDGGRTPAAALTGYVSTEDRVRALASGFQSHIPKPVHPAELAIVVATLAERPRREARTLSRSAETA